MTHQEFLSTFTKHLYVGGTKRNELIHELETHLEELAPSESPVVKIGNPRHLARRYNSEHLGLLGSIGFMYSLPILVALLVQMNYWLSSINSWLGDSLFLVIVVFLIFGPVWVSATVFRMHQAKRKLLTYVLFLPIIATLTLTLMAYFAYKIGQPNQLLATFDWETWQSEKTFIWTRQVILSFQIVFIGYFYSLTVCLMMIFIQGLKKTNITIFRKK